ncbi:MAG: hypothetical protein K1Y36_30550 [Blastocatellia bacterium]|nr:hypothetical protein [Blastocatellia bacterium]
MKTKIIGVRYSEAAQQRIIHRAFLKTNVIYDIQNAIRVMCEEEPVKVGAPNGNKNAKRKTDTKDNLV